MIVNRENRVGIGIGSGNRKIWRKSERIGYRMENVGMERGNV